MTHRPDRRTFLTTAGLGVLGLTLFPRCATRWDGQAVQVEDPWSRVPEILQRMQPPTFPDRHFPITDFGARGDGSTDCTEAFRQAIAACHDAGGGRVDVPAGTFLTGAIHLTSGANLHLHEAATILFKQDPQAYLPVVFTRWEGVELMNYSPFIYAFEAENIAITGSGILDGQADDTHWWPWKGQRGHGWTEGTPRQDEARAQLFEMAERGVPVAERVFGDGHYLRPQFIQPYRCRNVLIEGITIRRSPMWEINPVLCTNTTVRGVTVESHGPNNDGCDPESCRDVLIEDCYFDTGDDCIALKSGRNADGRRIDVPCENVIVRNCTMKDGHGGVVIGSEISGGARYVFAEQCQMDSPNLDRVLRIKTNSIRGGTVEHIYMRDIEVGEVADAVVRVNFLYEEGDAGPYDPIVRDVEVRNLTCRRSGRALYLRGYADSPIRDVRLIDCVVENVEEPDVVEHVRNVRLRNVRIEGTLINEHLHPTG